MLLYNLMTALVNPNKIFYKVFPVKMSVLLRKMMFTNYILLLIVNTDDDGRMYKAWNATSYMCPV